MNKIKELLLSSEYTIRERLFLLAGIMATAAMVGATVLAAMSGGNILVAIGPAIGTFAVGYITYYSFFHKKTDLGAAIIVVIGVWIILPYGYLKGGGAFSGSPSWFIIGFVIIFLLYRGKKFWIFYIISIVMFAITTYIGYAHPELVVALESQEAIYFDTFFAAVLVATLIGVLQHYQSEILEKELIISEEQHQRIEKLNAAQNKFFSSMSHEIRTPINTIIGLNEMTLREKNLSEEAVENSINIQNASKLLLSLINDILDLSKIQSGQMELAESQYETSRMLSDIVNLLWNRARDKGLQFNIHVGDAIPSMLYGDEIRIKQIIINILTNAIKYTHEGYVTLTVDGEKKDTNHFDLKISVEDSGQGIRKENLPALFDTFKRFENEDNKTIEGTGLGLSITKQLVELMGGTITVDSIYTKGSTFRVSIPQKIVNDTPMNFRSVAEINREMSEYHQSFEAPDAAVLIVDDNDMNRMVCRKLLRDTKVKIDLAASGKECLEKTRDKHYDVIFMDHEMPEMDGLETLDHIRTQANGLCHETPIVALTANAGSDRNQFYMDHGFQAYLAKPIHGSLLEATLLNLLPLELIEKTIVNKEEETIQILENQRKKPIIISTDCVCDLPKEILEYYDIRIMPYYIITNEGRFRDTTEIDADNLYAYLLEENREIATEASSITEYEKYFGQLLTEADKVIHYSASKELSNSYDNARTAADNFDNVTVINTGSVSSGLGMQAIEASKLALKGKSVEEIIAGVDRYKSRIVTNFLIPTITLLSRARKQSLFVKLFVNVLNFEPCFAIKNGKIFLQKLFPGYLNDATSRYIRSNFYKKNNIDTTRLFVIYSGCNEEERQNILKEIEKYIHFNEIILQKASATLSANSGLHSIGLAYERKE